MIIVTSRKNLIRSAVVLVLICAVSIGFLSFIFNEDSGEKLGLLLNNDDASEQISLATFLASTDTGAQEDRKIEIFDVKKGKVIKRVSSNQIIQDEARRFLSGITGIYVKVKAFPDNGYIIRIPLNPSVTLQSQWLKGTIDETFIILPEGKVPYLLVLDNSERPFFFNFEGSTAKLLKNLNFQPEAAP